MCIRDRYIGESLNALLKGHMDTHLLRRLQDISPDIGRGKYIPVLIEAELDAGPNIADSRELLRLKQLRRTILRNIILHSPRPIYAHKDSSLVVLYSFPDSSTDNRIYEYIREQYTMLREGIPSVGRCACSYTSRSDHFGICGRGKHRRLCLLLCNHDMGGILEE